MAVGRNPGGDYNKFEIYLAADGYLPITVTVNGTKYDKYGSSVGSFSGFISAGEMTGSVIDSGNSGDQKAARYVGTCSPSSSNGGLYTYTFIGFESPYRKLL